MIKRDPIDTNKFPEFILDHLNELERKWGIVTSDVYDSRFGADEILKAVEVVSSISNINARQLLNELTVTAFYNEKTSIKALLIGGEQGLLYLSVTDRIGTRNYALDYILYEREDNSEIA